MSAYVRAMGAARGAMVYLRRSEIVRVLPSKVDPILL